MKQVNIIIGPTGKVEIEAVGFTGSTCDDATKVFEQAFSKGAKTDKEYKPEYWQADNAADKATSGW
jgi:Protein of unknown function (DUF2997)